MAEFYFNPWDPQFRADPYPAYRVLVEAPPHLMNFGATIAVAARYVDVAAVLSDHRHFTAVPRRTFRSRGAVHLRALPRC